MWTNGLEIQPAGLASEVAQRETLGFLPGPAFVPPGVVLFARSVSLRWFILLSVLLHLSVFLAAWPKAWKTDDRTIIGPIAVDVVEAPVPAPPTAFRPSPRSERGSAVPRSGPALRTGDPASRPAEGLGRPMPAQKDARTGRETLGVPVEPGFRSPSTTSPPAGTHAVPGSRASRGSLPLLSAQALERFARTVPEAEAPPGPSVTMDTKELKYLTYLARIRERIESVWEYPRLARQQGWQGNLHVRFTIRRDGRLGGVTLLRSSGYPVLDDAALAALRTSVPFDSFPDVWEEPDLTITGNFIYYMGSWYVR